MREHNRYLQKVHEELSVYSQRLRHGELIEMTDTQEENWDKIQIIWKLLKDGNSDNDILKMAKNHPGLRCQERRARELLYMTYEVFADLRPLRNVKALKMLDSEAFRGAANLVMTEILKVIKKGTKPEKGLMELLEGLDQDEIEEKDEAHIGQYGLTAKEYEALAKLFKVYKDLRVEAGKIDGVYQPDSKNQDEKKKPQNIVIKKVVVNNNPTKEPPTDITYELD